MANTSRFTATIVGLGKIGLPLGVYLARNGITVIGADINRELVETIRSGREPFSGENNLESSLQETIRTGRFTVTTDTTEAVSNSNVVVIVVPLIVDRDSKEPDFRAIDAATQAVAKGLQPGTLVCYETTLPVGTTRTRFCTALERVSGLTCGTGFYLCFSPERVSSGRIFSDLAKYPKLVGGVDPVSTLRGVEFYSAGLTFDPRPDLKRENGVWAMDSCEAAELSKLAETTYRDINIAFANELAQYCDSLGVNVGDIIDASNSQPFSHIHQPGIAVGGHCIPVYPHLYLIGNPAAQLPRVSRSVNDAMPSYCVELLEGLVGSLRGKVVAVLGLAYRGGVKEAAFSGAWSVVEELSRRGAVPKVHDPLYTDEELEEMGLSPFSLGQICH